MVLIRGLKKTKTKESLVPHILDENLIRSRYNYLMSSGYFLHANLLRVFERCQENVRSVSSSSGKSVQSRGNWDCKWLGKLFSEVVQSKNVLGIILFVVFRYNMHLN